MMRTVLRTAMAILLTPVLVLLWLACLVGAAVGILLFGVRPHGHVPRDS